jgi:hypothetical protein
MMPNRSDNGDRLRQLASSAFAGFPGGLDRGGGEPEAPPRRVPPPQRRAEPPRLAADAKRVSRAATVILRVELSLIRS